ncbi:MAG: SDR family oxidoreductase [Steroidobacteraceae bacterium]
MSVIRFELERRRALVTGAASGIGLATARLFARSGARVALNDLPTPALDAAVELLRGEGGDVIAIPGDVGQASTSREIARRAADALAGLTRERARGLAAARTATALQRVGQPEDYAEVIVYLCAGAGYITGQVVPVTGGLFL